MKRALGHRVRARSAGGAVLGLGRGPSARVHAEPTESPSTVREDRCLRADLVRAAQRGGAGDKIPGKTEGYPIAIPNKRGKHMILGVWDIADTSNAFCSCSDVDFH